MTTVYLEKEGQFLILSFQYYDPGMVLKAKIVKDGKYDPNQEHWKYPLSSYPGIKMYFKEFEKGSELIKWEEEKEHQEILLAGIKMGPLVPVPWKFRVEPFKHQITGIDCLTSMEKIGLFDEMGLGKTMQAAIGFAILKQKGKLNTALVVCPKTLKTTWEKEIKEHTGMSCQKLDSKIRIQPGHPFYIINYDNLSKREGDILNHIKPDLLIGDECQKISNPRSVRAKSFLRIAKKVQRIYMLSGTPIQNRPENIWTILSIICPEKVENYHQFLQTYCELGNRWSKLAVTGYRNLDKLEKIVKRVSIRRLKSECLDLPPILHNDLYADLAPRQKEIYNQMRSEERARIRTMDNSTITKEAVGILAKLTRLMQITSSPHLIGEVMNELPGKINVLDDLLEDLIKDNKEKIIVSTVWREMNSKVDPFVKTEK